MTAAQLWKTACEMSDSVFDKNEEISLSVRIELQQTLEKLLIADLEYGMRKRADELLWHNCHKQCIDFLQRKLAKKQPSSQHTALYQMIVSSAFGSLQQLLVKVCAAYDLKFGMIKSDVELGIAATDRLHQRAPRKAVSDQSASKFAIFCLLHLGDICRYQKKMDSAQMYYRKCLEIDASNGQSWNQLGVVETSKGDKLAATYCYFRALLIAKPFDPAAANIDRFYSFLVSNGLENLDCEKDYVECFLSFHAHCHQLEKVNSLESLSDRLMHCLALTVEEESIRFLMMFCLNVALIYRLGDSRDEAVVCLLVRRLTEAQIISGLNYCSRKSPKEFAKWVRVLFIVLSWITKDGNLSFNNRDSLLKAVCSCAKSLRTLLDSDLTHSFDYGTKMNVCTFLPLSNVQESDDSGGLDLLDMCLRSAADISEHSDRQQSSASHTLESVLNDSFSGSCSLLTGDGLQHSSSCTTPFHQQIPVVSETDISNLQQSTSVQSSDLTDINSLLLKSADEDGLGDSSRGLLKVRLASPKQGTSAAKEDTKSDAPRFQAQKLKKALTAAQSLQAPGQVCPHPQAHETHSGRLDGRNRPVFDWQSSAIALPLSNPFPFNSDPSFHPWINRSTDLVDWSQSMQAKPLAHSETTDNQVGENFQIGMPLHQPAFAFDQDRSKH